MTRIRPSRGQLVADAEFEPTIFELQVESSVNRVLEDLETTGVVAAVPRRYSDVVSPVSAAVALEPGQDLDVMGAPDGRGRSTGGAAEAGNSGRPSMSSSTPEREVWAMLLLISVAMLAAIRRRQEAT